MKILKKVDTCTIDMEELERKINNYSHNIQTYDARVNLINGSFFIDMYLGVLGNNWQLYLPDPDGKGLDIPYKGVRVGVAMVPLQSTENEAKAAAIELIEGLKW